MSVFVDFDREDEESHAKQRECSVTQADEPHREIRGDGRNYRLFVSNVSTDC